MKILSLIDAISGGGGMVMYNVIKGLPQHQHLVICPGHVQSWSIGLPKLIRDDQIPVFIASVGPSHQRNVQRMVEDRVMQYDPDIIINHWWRSSRFQRLNKFGKSRKVYGRAKTVLVSHNNDPSPPGYDFYVSVSKYNSKFQVHANKERKGQRSNHRVIYNGIDVERFNIPKNPMPDRFVIGRVSSLAKFKVPRDWINYVHSFNIPNLLHIIVGDGERRRQLQYDINKLGVQHKFRLLGEVPNTGLAMSRTLAKFDIVAYVTEKDEAFSLAMLEAMSAGLPIVTQNRGGMPEQIVHGKTGFLCNSRQEVKYYCELLSKNANMVKEMSRQARARARMFTIERMCQNYNTLFEELVYG